MTRIRYDAYLCPFFPGDIKGKLVVDICLFTGHLWIMYTIDLSSEITCIRGVPRYKGNGNSVINT